MADDAPRWWNQVYNCGTTFDKHRRRDSANLISEHAQRFKEEGNVREAAAAVGHATSATTAIITAQLVKFTVIGTND